MEDYKRTFYNNLKGKFHWRTLFIFHYFSILKAVFASFIRTRTYFTPNPSTALIKPLVWSGWTTTTATNMIEMEKSSRDFCADTFSFHRSSMNDSKQKKEKKNSFVGIKKICWMWRKENYKRMCVWCWQNKRKEKAEAGSRCQRWSEYGFWCCLGRMLFSIEFSEIYQSNFHTHNKNNKMKPFLNKEFEVTPRSPPFLTVSINISSTLSVHFC